MTKSRRGRIIELIEEGTLNPEILKILDKEFPPGTFKSRNSKAISGTRWDIGKKKPR
jgi:hypothetical protein